MSTLFLSHFAAATCARPNFLGLPTWYEYLKLQNVNGQCSPQLAHLSDVWLIIAAITEILLRLAALVAVFMIIWGGVKYTTSQGSPEATNQARSTLIDAAIGLLLATSAAVIVQFIAGSVHGS